MHSLIVTAIVDSFRGVYGVYELACTNRTCMVQGMNLNITLESMGTPEGISEKLILCAAYFVKKCPNFAEKFLKAPWYSNFFEWKISIQGTIKRIRIWKCAIPNCTTKNSSGFFKFPKNEFVHNQWLEACHLTSFEVERVKELWIL